MVAGLTATRQSAKKGVVHNKLNCFSTNVKIVSTSVAVFTPGTVVKLVDVAGSETLVDKAGVTDKFWGVVGDDIVYDSLSVALHNSIGSPLVMTVYGNDTIIVLESNAAIARGAEVEYVPASNRVITSGGTNTVLGIAMDKASAAGELIKVKLVINA
jgi:hypothetical protein